MGKHGKKQRQQQKPRRLYREDEEEEEEGIDRLPSSSYNLPPNHDGDDEDENVEDNLIPKDQNQYIDSPSKFHLYQKSVQSPKGDISYLLKFFLVYVGGRLPIHLQEDFCGTALLSTEWLRSDPRRTVVGVDLDLEALMWCLENNVNKIGPDGYSRISLFHGNVLQPLEATLVKGKFQDLIKNMTLSDHEDCLDTVEQVIGSESCMQSSPGDSINDKTLKSLFSFPARDIVCAFNYSCCCLQRRADLILYFKHALSALSRKGGIFVMDLYGGTSSERKLRLQRRFSNFTYVWEQAEFDIINRTTRISLHYHLEKKHTLRHAFTYNWRLWSLPEIKDCLEEAGFRSVHFWIRQMPDTQDRQNSEEFEAGQDVKYEEVSSFQQRDAWNAYIVGVAN